MRTFVYLGLCLSLIACDSDSNSETDSGSGGTAGSGGMTGDVGADLGSADLGSDLGQGGVGGADSGLTLDMGQGGADLGLSTDMGGGDLGGIEPVPCGGRLGDVCGIDDFCDFEQGCGFDDGQGECQRRPQGCIELPDSPVCGCDGETYANECVAHSQGIDMLHDGPCELPACQDADCGPAPGAPNVQCPDGSIGGPICARDDQGMCGWTIRECPSEDPCVLPADSGPCEAAIPRWFHNPATDRCEEFTYGGCGGNANNFQTREACEALCGEDMPPMGALCGTRGAQPCPRDMFCDFPPANQCGHTDRGGMCRVPPEGCDANFDPVCGCDGETYSNACAAAGSRMSVASEGECEGEVCALPAEPGPCRGSIPSWFHNAETGVCEEFIYGGCEGNDNRFETRELCEMACP